MDLSTSVTIGSNTIVDDTVTTLSSLVSISTITTGVWEGTTIAVNQGGTGDTTYIDGQLLIGNTTGNTLAKATLTAGDDIDITNMNEVIWAFLTRGRVDRRRIVIPDVPGFYRDPHKDHWGRLGIDATMPFGREAEFERKLIPG